MVKHIFRCFIFFVFAVASVNSYAAYTYSVNMMRMGFNIDSADCAAIIQKVGLKGTCSGLSEAVDKSVSGLGSGFFTFNSEKDGTFEGTLNATGTCKAGTKAGTADVAAYYVNSTTLEIVSTIVDPAQVTGVISSCKVRSVDVGGCFVFNSSAVNNVALKVCGVYLEETGDTGGSDYMPSSDAPPYGGGAGSGGGGGTTPGDGTGTGGGTGGGGTGGGGTGGGDTGGGGTGGGGTGGGGTGGGGTGGGGTGGGGTGGGGTGDTQAHCGAPGQAACNINEGNTPTGIGGLMDGLMKLVDGIGEGRQSGIDDAKSDAGKNTSLTNFAVSLPTGVCVNPSVTLPNSSRTWTVDICQYVGILGVAFDALWAFAFVVGVVSLVGRATAKPVA